MNTVCISGNLTKDPEVSSPQGSDWSVINFSIANNDEQKKNKDGSYEKVASYFDCTYWTKKPSYWLKVMKKGHHVTVTARLKLDMWTDKDGNNRQKVKLVVQPFPIVHEPKNQNATENVIESGEVNDEIIPF